MWRILQQDRPGDFVIATGVQHSVREFVEAAAAELKLKLSWRGKGANEKGFDAKGRVIVAVDPRYYRPAEVDTPLGNCSSQNSLTSRRILRRPARADEVRATTIEWSRISESLAGPRWPIQIETHFAHELFHILPHILLGGWIAQQVGGVIRADDLDAAVVDNLPT